MSTMDRNPGDTHEAPESAQEVSSKKDVEPVTASDAVDPLPPGLLRQLQSRFDILTSRTNEFPRELEGLKANRDEIKALIDRIEKRVDAGGVTSSLVHGHSQQLADVLRRELHNISDAVRDISLRKERTLSEINLIKPLLNFHTSMVAESAQDSKTAPRAGPVTTSTSGQNPGVNTHVNLAVDASESQERDCTPPPTSPVPQTPSPKRRDQRSRIRMVHAGLSTLEDQKNPGVVVVDEWNLGEPTDIIHGAPTAEEDRIDTTPRQDALEIHSESDPGDAATRYGSGKSSRPTVHVKNRVSLRTSSKKARRRIASGSMSRRNRRNKTKRIRPGDAESSSRPTKRNKTNTMKSTREEKAESETESITDEDDETVAVDQSERDDATEATYRRLKNELFTAIREMDLDAVRAIFEQVAQMDSDAGEDMRTIRQFVQLRNQGRTPLMKIVENMEFSDAIPFMEIVKEYSGGLYDKIDGKHRFYPQLTRRNSKPFTALSLAIKMGDLEMFRYLLDNFNPTSGVKKLELWHLIGREVDVSGEVIPKAELDTEELRKLLKSTHEDVRNFVLNWCVAAEHLFKDE